MEDFQGTPAEKSDFIANTIELQHLLRTAEAQAGKEGVTVIGNLGRGLGKTIDTAREEYNHAWQRTLSDTGDADQHLPKPQMKELYRALPMKAHAYLDASNYPNTYADRVVETAAKLMAGKDMGIPHEEAAAFLSKYFDAVAKEHGDESLQSLQHVVGVAKQLRDERIGNGTAEAGVPNERPDEGVLGSTQEGRPEGDRGSPSQEVLADKGAGRDSDGVKKTDENYYGRYRYSLSDYDNTIQHRFAHTSVYSGTDGTFLRARLAFHPEIAKQARSILAPEKSFIQTNPVLSKILGISTQAKHSLLSLSGFHWAQIGLRGVESGVNPIKPFVEMLKGNGGWDMNNPEHLALVESGGTHPGIPGASESFTEGVKGGAGPISKIPGVGHVLDSVNNALFGANGFIDRMKLETALSFAKRLESIKPELTKTERFKIAGQMANYRYGGLDYLQMGRSQTAQDILRLTLLAPDWMESNFRDAASMLGPYGRLSRFDFARIALYNFAAAQTINMLSTGKMHLEQPFGVVSKDGKKVYSVRTMPQDIYHALTQPMDYATNRLNPLIARTGVEALFGRDKQGHLRDVGEQIKDLLANVSPIPLQGVTNALTGNFHPGETGGDYVRSALGLTSKPNNSSAEQLAYKLASQNSSSGRMSSDELAHFHKVMTYEDRLRDGDVSALADLHREVLQGKIPMSSYRQVLKGSQQSRLSSTINRLPMSDAIDVWNLSTNDERGVIGPVMMKKIMDFRNTEQQRLTPAERARMDVKLAAVVDGMFTAAGQK